MLLATRRSTAFAAMKILGVGARGYQTKGQFHAQLRKRWGPDDVIDTKKALETMRQMISWRSLKPNGANSIEYKNGLRALSMVAGADGGVTKPQLTIAEIEGVLSRDNGVTWRLLEELLCFDFSTELESLGAEQKAIVRFNRVHGIGRVKAETYVKHGARSFGELLDSKGKEYGLKVSDGQKLAMRYHSDMENMIPREEVAIFHRLIAAALQKADPALNFEIMGSYRRGEPVSSDIDMVVWHPSYRTLDLNAKPSRTGPSPGGLMDRVLTSLESVGLLTPDKYFSRGDRKAMALTRLPSPLGPSAVYRQIDIRWCPHDSLPYMLLGNTGDDSLIRILRAKAVDKGWVLNEYGMAERDLSRGSTATRPGTEIKVENEREIFEKLGVPYLEPTERSWTQYEVKIRDRQLWSESPSKGVQSKPQEK